MNLSRTTIIILSLIVLVLVIVPLMIKNNFSGADSRAMDMVTKENPDFKPWFKNIWEPPGGEIESLLFALQAAVGSGILGYYFGFKKAEKKYNNQELDDANDRN